MRSDINKVGFVTQRTYFQAKGRFFDPAKFKSVHIRMTTRSLGLKHTPDLSTYNPKTASNHRTLILELYGWKSYEVADRKALEEQALLLADKQTDSEDILFSLLEHCWRNKIAVPAYSEFVDIISHAFIEFEETMRERIESTMTYQQKMALLSFIDSAEMKSQFSEIKRINQSKRQRKLNYNAELLKRFKDLFFIILPLLDNLNLTPEAVKHLAEQVHKSTLSQIRNIKDVNNQCLLLAAFVQDQFFLRQDYAIDAFIAIIRAIANRAKNHDRSLKSKDEKELQEANKSVLNSSKNSTQILKLIIEVSNDPAISLAEKNEKVLHLAESYFASEEPDLMAKIGRLETSLQSYDLNINFYQFLFEKSDSLQRSLSPLLRLLLTFDENNSQAPLNKPPRSKLSR